VVIGRQIIRLPVTTSTMDEVNLLAAQGEPEGLVVVADRQTAGRGRAGRAWHSASESGLLLSVLLRPQKTPAEIAVFPLIIGLTVADAIDEIAGVRSSLKWPNDVLIDDKKVAGILMTSRIMNETIDYLNVGIGINVAGSDLPPDGTSLALASSRFVDRDKLFERILTRLDNAYASFCNSGSGPFIHDWTEKAAYLSERVEVESEGMKIEGIMRGVDDFGSLLIETEDGSEMRIVAGELTRGPRRAEASNDKVAN
jgi:BirA family transcriptional regulator, biotin operon repressor / biotin---[acetyl-CoA-carboxylase] ligase